MLEADPLNDTLRVDLGAVWNKLYPKQEKWFWWDPGSSDPVTEFLGGFWRSGKTEPAVAKYIKLCLINGWNESYGRDHPRSFVTAPTAKTLRDATIATLLRLTPDELILKHKKAEGEIHWINGHVSLLRSAEGELDGFEATHGLADEVHKPTYWLDPTKITNYKARCSDKRAVRRSFIACGLALAGRVRETFEFADNVALLATADNPNNSRAFLESLLVGIPDGYEDAIWNGGWMSPPSAIFHMFSAAKHIVDWEPNMQAPVHVGMDLGNHARVVFVQQRPDGVMFVVDEMITHLVGAKDSVAAIKASKWAPLIVPGKSVVCIDPTIKRDDLFTIHDAFPMVEVKQFSPREPGFSVEYGLQQMQIALLNALKQVRLVVHRSLVKNRNGVVDAFESCRRHEILGHVVKDDRTDHSRDALRVVVCRLFPEQLPSASVVSR